MKTARRLALLLLVAAGPVWAADAEKSAMAALRLTTETAVAAGCVYIGPVHDDSVKDLRRKIVRAGGDTGVLSFGMDDTIRAEVFRCGSAATAAPGTPLTIPPPPPGTPPPPPPGPWR